MANSRYIIVGSAIALCSMVNFVSAQDSTCSGKDGECRNKTEALHLKIGAIASILVAGTIGVCLPVVGRTFSALRPDKNIFFVIKAFAAGVILATGFVHVLPDAFDSLTSECLSPNPWGNFPFAGFIAMMAGVCTLLVDALATGYYERSHFQNQNKGNELLHNQSKENQLNEGTDPGSGNDSQHENHLHAHSHATHGHAHGSNTLGEDSTLRHRVIAQAEYEIQPERYVDGKGRPARASKHGGMRAAAFIFVVEALENMAFISNATNLVRYFSVSMHYSLAVSANMLTNYMGTSFLLTLVGGFISDSFSSRFSTIVSFASAELLGLLMLTLQAHFPGLTPPPCGSKQSRQNCKHPTVGQAALLYTGLYTVALGTGAGSTLICCFN